MKVEESRRDGVVRAMSDRYARKILASTILEAKSIEEISRENGIPISTCYRRVHELIRLQLLKTESTIVTTAGKRFETFKSELKGATITLLSDKLFVDVQ